MRNLLFSLVHRARTDRAVCVCLVILSLSVFFVFNEMLCLNLRNTQRVAYFGSQNTE